MNNRHSFEVIIAVDIGTGSSRALLVDHQLNIQSIDSIPNHLIEPSPGWVEQNPEEVLQATLQVIRQAVSRAEIFGWRVVGLCFSTAASSLMALDLDGNPLGNALTWADSRAKSEVVELSEKASSLYQQTGTPLHASYWLPKLCWLQKHKPELIAKARCWMGIKDYVIWRLTGERVTDFCNAAATGMLNLQSLNWSELACALANTSPSLFPSVQPTTFIIPHIQADMSSTLGLPQEMIIILGAGDGPLANLGSGVVHPEQVATTIGSSGACRSIATGPFLQDRRMQTWSYPLLKNLWVIAGAENSGGLIVDWFQNNIMLPTKDSFASMIQAAQMVSAGCNGLIFLPYLLGERAPIWNSNARGVFLGLEYSHTYQHMARAVFEGTIFALYDVYQVLRQFTPSITEIRVSGGYTRSPFWLSIQASMFERELIVLENHECSALGAAILGYYALGIYPNLQSGVDLIKVKETILPNPDQSKQYQKLIPLYNLAYQQLKPVFEGLETFRSTLI